MNAKWITCLVVWCLFLIAPSIKGQKDNYVINRGDVLDVVVMEHPEFSLSGITVLPDGCIQYPGIGGIKVAGMSSDELTLSIEKSVEKFVVNPVVSIYIRKIQNQMLNVLGYVNKPGQFQIFEGMDLLSALSMAGGIKNIKKGKQIVIVRADQSIEEIRLKDYMNANHRVQELPLLYASDTVYVKEPAEINWAKYSFFSTMLMAIATILNIAL